VGGKLLQAFDFISVRDEHTRDLIERLGVKNNKSTRPHIHI